MPFGTFIYTPVHQHFPTTLLLKRVSALHQINTDRRIHIQDDTKKRELLKNPTKIEEIQEKKLLTEIEPLQLAF